MTEKEKKVCPLLALARASQNGVVITRRGSVCIGSACAWWIPNKRASIYGPPGWCAMCCQHLALYKKY